VPEPFDPQSLNRYSYVRNSPTNRIDPTGAFDFGDFFGGITGFFTNSLPSFFTSTLPDVFGAPFLLTQHVFEEFYASFVRPVAPGFEGFLSGADLSASPSRDVLLDADPETEAPSFVGRFAQYNLDPAMSAEQVKAFTGGVTRAESLITEHDRYGFEQLDRPIDVVLRPEIGQLAQYRNVGPLNFLDVNPRLFARPPGDIASALGHEVVHAFQTQWGLRPPDWPQDTPYPPAEAAANLWEIRNAPYLAPSPWYQTQTERLYQWYR
jgi:hypothetical protein